MQLPLPTLLWLVIPPIVTLAVVLIYYFCKGGIR